ncbi:MAG: hypothetical protein KDD83_01030 [Caldilineaceae bacterium]|nr:hypothetical protein [Caldilineaceae bacterium]MCB9159342.1 hypothetical protein [Caldilineaceae bacterium]
MDTTVELTPDLRRLYSHAYVLGGSPCSGKSTVAARLVAQYGLQSYKVDDYEQTHMARCTSGQPTMFRYATMRWDDIWMQPVAQQVDDEFAFYRERFTFILQDLAQMDPARPTLLEGAALLPALMRQCGVDPARVLYMVPTASFQLHHYGQRPWIHDILAQCDDPAQAFANWMARDQQFGREVLRQARACGFPTMVVDGGRSLDVTTAGVASMFGLAADGFCQS